MYRYYILLAEGPVYDGLISYHSKKVRTSTPGRLDDVQIPGGLSNLKVKLHGAFMIGAWIFSASCGILMARYFKRTFTSARCCKLDFWFVWHRMFMIITWGLTIAGFVLIFLVS